MRGSDKSQSLATVKWRWLTAVVWDESETPEHGTGVVWPVLLIN